MPRIRSDLAPGFGADILRTMGTSSVKIQATPNPNARKFVLPAKQFDRPLNFSSPEAAAAHPLARQLFSLGAVYNVFLAQDFVTVNKLPDSSWEILETEIQAIIARYFNL